MKKYKLLILLVFVFSGVRAQEMLTVQKAIEIAVEKNYNIRIAKNNSAISEVEKSTLNSGYLPRVTVSGGVNYSDETQGVTFSDGNSTNINGAVTESYNASFTAEYTLFDASERKFKYLKKKENFKLIKIDERRTIEITVVSM